MDVLRWIALSALSLAPWAASAGGEGLSADADRVPWARFQGRIAYAATVPLASTPVTPSDGTGLQVQGLSLMGDVYFGAGPGGSAGSSAGGFRATSGVIVGTRSSLWGMSAMSPASGPLNVDRRFSELAANLGTSPTGSRGRGTCLPGIGLQKLAARSGWSSAPTSHGVARALERGPARPGFGGSQTSTTSSATCA